MAMKGGESYHLCHFSSHHRLATPVAPWERLKIGGGTPPLMTRLGWLVFYHGVCESAESTTEQRRLSYSAGVLAEALVPRPPWISRTRLARLSAPAKAGHPPT